MTFGELANMIWSVADLLRGDYKQSDYGKVILPFTLLRRLDCVLEPTRAAVLAEYEARKGLKIPLDEFLLRKAKLSFYNTSELDFPRLLGDPANLRANLSKYVSLFSPNAKEIFEKYDFQTQIDKLDNAGLLLLVVQRFAAADLHPDAVDNHKMGRVYEELIRKWAETSNETAGEHFTARDVIRLMVELLFAPDRTALTEGRPIRRIYDPACGTGGMLSEADEGLHRLNPHARLAIHGQELNPESYAVCKADMLVKGHDISQIVLGNSFTADGHAGSRFDYMLSNPPFGVDWKKVQDAIVKEHQSQGWNGRFGPGLPRVSDGSLLFLLHLISKMERPERGGCRMAIVLNGSPLFTGGAGSGESNIRKFVLENDLLDAIVALPTDMFHNTGIATYIWVLDNRKQPQRKGKVQMIDGSGFFQKMRKSVGSKRKELGVAEIARMAELYEGYADVSLSKVFESKEFGYSTITVERPLRLNFAVTDERLARLDDVDILRNRAGGVERVKEALALLGADQLWKNRAEFLKRMRKHLGAHAIELTPAQEKIVLLKLGERDPSAEPCTDGKGRPEADPELRDTENVPLREEIATYFAREVLPHVPDAWIDESKTKVGYEIPFNRYFYTYTPPRPLEEIDADLKRLGDEILGLLGEVVR